jgi:hypothetical protein
VSALSFRLATEGDTQALLALRLAIDADQAERFGDDRYAELPPFLRTPP